MNRSFRYSLLASAMAALTLTNPATAATSSADQLLSDLEETCFPVILTEVVALSAALPRASASPDSTLCIQLNEQLDSIYYSERPLAEVDGLVSELAKSITPDEVPALYTSLVQLSANQITNISQHLRQNRISRRQDSANTADNSIYSTYIGGSAGANGANRFSVFVDGAMVDGSQDQTDNVVGYDLSTDHYTVGADYRFSDALIAGFAYGNSDTTLEYNEDQNQTDNTTDHYILYASWYRDNFAVDTMLAYASGEFETQRAILGSTAVGKADNSITYISIAGSYDFVDGGFTYGPFASFDYLDGEIDAFEETNGGGWEVAFAKQDVKSQIYAMGGQASYAASFGWGVLVPHFRAEWRTELEDGRDVIVGRFVQDPTSEFELTADDPDSNWYQVSGGVSAQFAHGIAVFLDYEEVIGYEDTDLSTFTLGARWEM